MALSGLPRVGSLLRSSAAREVRRGILRRVPKSLKFQGLSTPGSVRGRSRAGSCDPRLEMLLEKAGPLFEHINPVLISTEVVIDVVVLDEFDPLLPAPEGLPQTFAVLASTF